MSHEIQSAVEDAVVQAKADGTVLLVHETAGQIAATQQASGEAVHQIALDVVEEAARRGVAMRFTR